MGFRLPTPIRQFLKATSFWRDNYLILREFKNFRRIAVIAVVCTIIGASLEGATVGLIASFLQGLTNPNEPPIQTGINWFDVWFLATKAPVSERVYRLAALILLAIWLRFGFSYLGGFYSRVSELNLAARLRKRLFDQLESLSLSYYSKSRSGELINSITTEVNQAMLAFNNVAKLIARGYTLLVYVISMFWLSWQLSIVSVMMFSLLSVGLTNMVARVREASFAVPKADGHLASVAIEFINGIRTVQASATQDFERQRFYQATEQLTNARTKVIAVAELVKPIADGVSSTILIAIVTVSFIVFVVAGELRAASLLTFMFVLFRMMPLVSQVNGIRARLSSYKGNLSNIQELLRRDNKTYLENGNIQFSVLKQSIDFVDVDFGYSADELVLRGITLSIKKGETTDLVGAGCLV